MAPRIDDIILPVKDDDDDFDFKKCGGLDVTFDEEEETYDVMPLGFGAVDKKDVIYIDQIEEDAATDDDVRPVLNDVRDHVIIRIESSSESDVVKSDEDDEVRECESEILVVDDEDTDSHLNQINRGRYDSAEYDFASEDEPLITDVNDETDDETEDDASDDADDEEDIKSSVAIRVCNKFFCISFWVWQYVLN